MANPIAGPKGYRVHFCYRGDQQKWLLRTHKHDLQVAQRLQTSVDAIVARVKSGDLEVPPGVHVRDYVFGMATGGNVRETHDFRSSAPSLTEVIEEYKATLRPPHKAASTCRTERLHLRHLVRYLEHIGEPAISVDNILPRFFDAYKRFRYMQKVTTDTVSKELATFQSLCKFAVTNGYTDQNPLKSVRRDKSQTPTDRFRSMIEARELLMSRNFTPREEQQIRRFRVLSPAELDSLIDLAAGHWLHSILQVLRHTGMRRGEVCRLAWSDVDLEHKVMIVASCKQSRTRMSVPRHIPITKALTPVFECQRGKTGHLRWVFTAHKGGPLRPEALGRAFRALLHATEYEGLGLHAIRHSVATNLAASGIDQRLIDEIMGHTTEVMRERYRHFQLQHCRVVLDSADI